LVRARLYKLQKGCTRLAAASDKFYQLLAHDRWFSPGTPASSTTINGRHDISPGTPASSTSKIGRHNIAEILLKVALNIKNQLNQNFCLGNMGHMVSYEDVTFDLFLVNTKYEMI